jgi:DNA (cytosine-5)-methyltransferase 1
MKKPTVIDLFCGAGGMSKGFKEANFQILLAIDNNAAALETYKKNNPETTTILADIEKVSNKKILEVLGKCSVDVIAGGPPCQGFSNANRIKNLNDRRNQLYKQFVRIVKLLKPKFFVMENVRGILSAKNGQNRYIIDDIKIGLKEYNIVHQILFAANYGVPQLRKRAFIIGRKGNGSIIFPKETHLNNWIPVKKFLLSKENSPKNLFYSKKLIDGFKRREIMNKQRGFGFKWQFLNLDKPSYTIPARYFKDGANALVKYSNSKIRMLDWKECARIQTFPNDYIFTGSKRQIYAQIGNAVPPLLSYNVAKSIRAELVV